MRNKKLLAIVLLGLSFYFASGAGWGITPPGLVAGGISGVGEKLAAQVDRLRGLAEKEVQESQLPERYTFLVVPTDKDKIRYTLSILESFLDIYSDPGIPEEFAFIFPTGIREFLQNTELWSKVREYSWIQGLLLTMAYQQGYEIEHITSNYVILAKPVYKEELEEWEERLGEEE